MAIPINIFWFRRDLRLHDNAGLYHAMARKRCLEVYKKALDKGQ